LLELQAGAEIARVQHAEKARELEVWIDLLEQNATIIPFDSAVARETARLMKNKSQDLFEDATIAATARVYGLTVATRNTKDFRHFDVPQFNPFQFRA
jgi:predicted nucleic acid-binding protein